MRRQPLTLWIGCALLACAPVACAPVDDALGPAVPATAERATAAALPPLAESGPGPVAPHSQPAAVADGASNRAISTTAPATPAQPVCVEAHIEGWPGRHQSIDGAWRCATFHHRCRKNVCDGAGSSDDHTVATTSLMLLAFVGAGHSSRRGKYRERVHRAVKYLHSVQRADGRVGTADRSGEAASNHALATWALCEDSGAAHHPLSRRIAAENALRHLLDTQDAVGGWPHGRQTQWCDAALTVWSCFALLGARAAGFEVPEAALVRADAWFDWASDERSGLVGWRQRLDTGARPDGVFWMSDARALTAGVAAIRLLRGATLDDPRVATAIERLRADLPDGKTAGRRDFLYWFFGTLASFHAGGDAWRGWSAALKPALVKTQRRGADEDGSWDPSDLYGAVGGRVYATAINSLTLETYYRYGTVLGGSGRRRPR